jgi:hypothetical protein
MSYGMLAICIIAEIVALKAGRRAARVRARAIRRADQS